MTTADDIPIFVINLARSPARLARFMADNTIPGLAIMRVEAIDGEKLDRAALIASALVAPDLSHSNNVIACSLTHIHCWQKIVALDRPVVICEDDAVLRHDFPLIHRHFSSSIAQADIVFWCFNLDMHLAYEVPSMGICTMICDQSHFAEERNFEVFQAQQSISQLYRVRRIWGSAAYTITPHGARRLLELILPLRNDSCRFGVPTGVGGHRHYRFDSRGIDMDIGLIHVHDVLALVAVPPVVVTRYDKAASTIDSGDPSARVIREAHA